MIGYIYQIINQVNNRRYVGKTIDIKRRKNEHLSHLRKNEHINKKLQSAWNKYGEKNFIFEFEAFELDSMEELNMLEKIYIKKYNSYLEGYNLTEGGDGGNTRSKLNYEEYCLVYLGCQWQGLSLKIAEYLNVDSSCISSILREKSYLHFKERADLEPQSVKDAYIDNFRKIFNIPKEQKFDENRVPTHLTEEEYFYCLCIASTYGRGIEIALSRYFNKHKSFLSNGMKSAKTQGKAYNAKQRFLKLDIPTIQKIGKEKFIEWNIQQYSKSTLKEEFNNKWRQ